MNITYSVELRNRKTGNSDFVILKTNDHDEAYKLAKSFNEMNVKYYYEEICIDNYIDGSEGYVADVYNDETDEVNGYTFINDEAKMCDFFHMKRENFLDFYSYLTNEDYCLTLCDVLEAIDYHNKEELIEEWKSYAKTEQYKFLPNGCDIMRDIVAPSMFMKLFVDTKTN